MARLLFGRREAAEEIKWRLELFNAKPRIEEDGGRFTLEFTDLSPRHWKLLREGKNPLGGKLI